MMHQTCIEADTQYFRRETPMVAGTGSSSSVEGFNYG